MTEQPEKDPLRILVRELLERNSQLQTALDSRIVIEQAKGVLAERLGMSVEEAFRVLRRAARDSRTRLHEIAAHVIAGPETPPAVLDATRAAAPATPVGDTEAANRSDMRIAENEMLFRRVNEQLKAVEEPLGPDERLQFLCECGDPTCADFVFMSAAEYEEVRSDPRRFMVLPGHEELWVERVLDRRNGYLLVEKQGPTAAVAEATDPREKG